MAGQEERDDHADVISAMFALLTARLEDAAAIAGESQARLSGAELRTNARSIQGLIAEADTLWRAITALLGALGRGDRDVDDK